MKKIKTYDADILGKAFLKDEEVESFQENLNKLIFKLIKEYEEEKITRNKMYEKVYNAQDTELKGVYAVIVLTTILTELDIMQKMQDKLLLEQITKIPTDEIN